MPVTKVGRISELNDLDKIVMQYIDWWVHEKKTTIPQRQLLSDLAEREISPRSVEHSLQRLLKLGYIRRAYTTTNRTFYVMLRGVN